MRRILLLIFAALALGSQEAQALALTVEQCVALGLDNNPVLKAHGAKVESSNQDTRIARSAFMPTLRARGSYAAIDQPQRIVIDKDLLGPGVPASDVDIRGEKDFYLATLTLRQNLFAGGRITHAYQRDNEFLASARHEFGNQRTQLIYELKRTFYEALIHQAYADSYAQQLNARQEALRVATVLADEGLVGTDQVLQARARLIFSKAELLQARQRADNALDQLHRLLDVNYREEINLVDTSTYAVLKDYSPELSETALVMREDYKQLESQIKAAEESIKVAKSGYLPQIYAEGGYLRQRETDLAQADNWGLSINLDWPLFEGGKTDAEVVKAAVEKQRLENLRRDLAVAIRNDVQAGQRSVQQKQLLVEAYLVNLQAEEQAYNEMLDRQAEGEILANVQQEQKARLLLARANYVESIHQARIAIAALEAAAATSLDHQLDVREIYQPASLPPDHSPAKTEPSAPAATIPAMPLASPAAPPSATGQSLPAIIETAPQHGDSPSLAIQLGAFKSSKRAQSLMKSLKKQYPGKTFETVATDGWHKVRVTQLFTRDAAESALQELGGKGLIVRASGHR